MNDCFFNIIGCDPLQGCDDCTMYLSVNNDEGEELLKEYEEAVELLTAPITAIYRKKATNKVNYRNLEAKYNVLDK